MRTKFKAWKKTNGPEIFEDIRAIDFEKNIIRIGYKLSEYTTRIDEESLDNVELLQSTGLFDKNGREIFEGDILNYRDEYRVVEMYDGAWIARAGEKRLIVKMAVLSGAKIIGNRFEHPHLLGED